MTEIPADVQEAATAAFNKPMHDGQGLWQMLPSYFHDEVISTIASAIMAEREKMTEKIAEIVESASAFTVDKMRVEIAKHATDKECNRWAKMIEPCNKCGRNRI